MNYDEMIAVLQAAKEGRVIQYESIGKQWIDMPRTDGLELVFNFAGFDYRVKPEPPKPREWWVNQYHDMAEEAYLYDSKEAADAANIEACDDPDEELKLRCVRVREVLEDQE